MIHGTILAEAGATFHLHRTLDTILPRGRKTSRPRFCSLDFSLPTVHLFPIGTAMIAFEVRLNGKRICTAGADDLGILSTSVSACGKLGKKTFPRRPDEKTSEVFYSVGGLTSRSDSKKDVHLSWKSVAPLVIGDVVEVKVVETEKVDRARSRKSAKPNPAKSIERT